MFCRRIIINASSIAGHILCGRKIPQILEDAGASMKFSVCKATGVLVILVAIIACAILPVNAQDVTRNGTDDRGRTTPIVWSGPYYECAGAGSSSNYSALPWDTTRQFHAAESQHDDTAGTYADCSGHFLIYWKYVNTGHDVDPAIPNDYATWVAIPDAQTTILANYTAVASGETADDLGYLGDIVSWDFQIDNTRVNGTGSPRNAVSNLTVPFVNEATGTPVLISTTYSPDSAGGYYNYTKEYRCFTSLKVLSAHTSISITHNGGVAGSNSSAATVEIKDITGH